MHLLSRQIENNQNSYKTNPNMPTPIRIRLKQLCELDSKSTFNFCHPTFDFDNWSNFTTLATNVPTADSNR